MKRVGRCPYCGELSEYDTRRLDGGAEAVAHIRQCENAPTRRETS